MSGRHMSRSIILRGCLALSSTLLAGCATVHEQAEKSRIYVANESSNSVTVIDGVTFKVVGTVDARNQSTHDLALSRDGKKLDETHEGESGQGLMEALAFHPSKPLFVMAGRLFQGQWNLALFDSVTGKNLHAIDAKHRITDARFTVDGARLLLAKAKQQEKKKDGKWPDYGLVEVHAVTLGEA